MRIVIISDVHNNTTNLKKVLDYCASNKITKIICCGDLSSNETLDFLNDNFEGEILYAIGNAEEGQLDKSKFQSPKFKRVIFFEDFGEVKIADKNVAFVHFPDAARKLALSGKYNFVFYGHTHKPWTEKIGKCEMLNPGTTGGEIYAPTFAVWNTDDGKFELIRVHDLK